MNLRLFDVLPCLLFMLTITLSSTTKAEEDGLVEIRTKESIYQSYRDRRTDHGWYFFVGQENYRPIDYFSKIDDGETYESMFGTLTVPMLALEFGYKYNMLLGSLGLIGGYSSGYIQSDRIGETRYMQVDRTSVRLMLTFDNLMSEPYIAPYVAGGMYRFGLDEKVIDIDFKKSGETGMGTLISVGALIQLNWIEEDVSRWALMTTGMENTYLDLFVTQHGKTSGSADPGTASAFNWGAGLRLEF